MAAPKNPQTGPNPKKASKRNRARRTDVLYEEVREKISNSRIVNRLIDHILGEKGVELSPSQVTAGLGLLKKVVPDLSATELSGPDGGPVVPSLVIGEAVVKATSKKE